jgi:hypothetical protein
MKADAVKKTAEMERKATSNHAKVANRVPLAERTQQILEEKEQKQAALKKNLEMEKIGKEMDECTFRPAINSKQNVKQNTENVPSGSRVDAMLKWAEEKSRKLAEIALDKDLGQASCTKKKLYAKDIEKATDRLYSQRVIMERKRLDLQAKEAEALKFRPEINKKSIQLAEKRKSKVSEYDATNDQLIDDIIEEPDIEIWDVTEQCVERSSTPKPQMRKQAPPQEVPKKKPIEQPQTPKLSRQEKSTEKRHSDKRNYFAQEDVTEYIEMERTIEKAVTLLNKDRRKSKEKVTKERPLAREDVVSQLKHLCEDIDNFVLMK